MLGKSTRTALKVKLTILDPNCTGIAPNPVNCTRTVMNLVGYDWSKGINQIEIKCQTLCNQFRPNWRVCLCKRHTKELIWITTANNRLDRAVGIHHRYLHAAKAKSQRRRIKKKKLISFNLITRSHTHKKKESVKTNNERWNRWLVAGQTTRFQQSGCCLAPTLPFHRIDFNLVGKHHWVWYVAKLHQLKPIRKKNAKSFHRD